MQTTSPSITLLNTIKKSAPKKPTSTKRKQKQQTKQKQQQQHL